MSATAKPKDELLTLAEVALELRQSVRSVRRKIADDHLPAFRINARVIRIRRSDLQRYLADRRTA